MRRLWLLIAGAAAVLALVNCQPGNPLGAIPQVGAAPRDLTMRFIRPATWEWGVFRNHDGAQLRSGSAKPMNPSKGTIVFVGGYTEFAEKYFELFNDLLERDYAVATLDWRGQGGSQRYLANPQMAHSIGFEHDRADLAQYLRQFGGTPVYLIAHSMGGSIAVRLLHDQPGLVKAAILSSPALRIGSKAGMPAWRARALAGLMVAAGLGEQFALGAKDWADEQSVDNALTHDPVRETIQPLWFREQAGLRVGGGTYRWAYEFYRSCATVMDPGYLGGIRTPVLVGSAGQDTYVDSAAQEEACPLLPDCQIEKFPESRHEIFMEVDAIRTPWLARIEQFIAAH